MCPASHHGASVGRPPRCPLGPPGPCGPVTTLPCRVWPCSGTPVAGNATVRRAAKPAFEHGCSSAPWVQNLHSLTAAACSIVLELLYYSCIKLVGDLWSELTTEAPWRVKAKTTPRISAAIARWNATAWRMIRPTLRASENRNLPQRPSRRPKPRHACLEVAQEVARTTRSPRRRRRVESLRELRRLQHLRICRPRRVGDRSIGLGCPKHASCAKRAQIGR